VGLISPSDSSLSTDVVIRLCPGRSEQTTLSEQQALRLCSALPVAAVDRSSHHLPALPSPWEALRLCSALPDVAAVDKPSLNLSMADIGVVSDALYALADASAAAVLIASAGLGWKKTTVGSETSSVVVVASLWSLSAVVTSGSVGCSVSPPWSWSSTSSATLASASASCACAVFAVSSLSCLVVPS
jgi:hypothetical protein